MRLPNVILAAGDNPYLISAVQRNLDDNVRPAAEATDPCPAPWLAGARDSRSIQLRLRNVEVFKSPWAGPTATRVNS